jgi:hypothetical protein
VIPYGNICGELPIVNAEQQNGEAELTFIAGLMVKLKNHFKNWQVKSSRI